MKPSLLIVTCTKAKTETEFQSRPIYNSLKKQYNANAPDVDFHVFKDNKRGLSECYNEVLKNPSYSNKTVLFVHDDVELEDIFLFEKLVNSPYDVTGLAGARSFNKKSPSLAWHLAAPREDYVGEVPHTKDGIIWTTVFGKTPCRTLTLDGLFLSCKVNALKEKGLEFDEMFNFHFYDIAFCMRANEKKATCGVLPIRAVHHGLGDSMLTNEWEQANIKFKEVYCK